MDGTANLLNTTTEHLNYRSWITLVRLCWCIPQYTVV